ncbi:hypothetical protein LEP1GSC008_3633 [Leptospira kirschneri serovar Bulgarica str. Nikolaevo]|uniref:Uncharacterized protein n=2 Tax=Leptospira kirschneri TaxID=29507 RepID=M6FIZ7_9LEPT|nr:hypothetical protein LEP1GSC008_3633 [Leptospira kirschneri serovar Bulgarica str. Nikolaevo]
MVFALEFCLENPNTIFSVIPKDFEKIRKTSISKKIFKAVPEFVFDSGFSKSFSSPTTINEFMIQFLLYSLSKDWNGTPLTACFYSIDDT